MAGLIAVNEDVSWKASTGAFWSVIDYARKYVSTENCPNLIELMNPDRPLNCIFFDQLTPEEQREFCQALRSGFDDAAKENNNYMEFLYLYKKLIDILPY